MKTFLLIVLLSPSFVFALPKAVIMLRHAEEPPENSNELSQTGVVRSEKLVGLFRNHPALKKLGTPVAIFAAGRKNEDSSIRSIQTMHFLSKAIKVEINDSFKRDDIKDLTKEILDNPDYNGKVVVICWQHKLMTFIAERLGMKEGPDYPSKKFDRLWILNFEKKKFKDDYYVRFQNLPQRIMPGDDNK